MYECILYDYGNWIFNIENKVKKYRQGVIETHRFYCNENEIYENKKPSNMLIYLRTYDNPNPIINVYFASYSSAKRYVKTNKNFLFENYGKLGHEGYFFESLIFSHLHSTSV